MAKTRLLAIIVAVEIVLPISAGAEVIDLTRVVFVMKDDVVYKRP